jgi:GTP-binding protein
VPSLDVLPPADRPEIAFAGRSNVGKSSLINAVVRQKALARTSNTPGRTQELNFFAVEGVSCFLVDMPGYGYAEAPKEKVAAWTRLVDDYLRGRPTLKRVFMLVDARHGLKAADKPVMKMLDEAAVSYQIVLTKADKIPETTLRAVIAATVAATGSHPAAHPVIHATSSVGGHGIDLLRAEIAALLTQ